MKNKIVLNNIRVNNNKVVYDYEVEGDIAKYFTGEKYFIEYTENIETVPESILSIPFVTNVLPIAWLTHATIVLKELDYKFYHSIPNFKKGYEKMYPKMSFNCSFDINKIVKNKEYKSSKTGCFFSGGLDATSTLISNIESKPILINLQGSDIALTYPKDLERMKKRITTIAESLDLGVVFVKSSFRRILKEKLLNKLVYPSAGDRYWHGFQHGIAIIGHAAPIAYKYKLGTIYIAASFTEGDNVTCASDPTIDNFVKLSSTSISHDGYNMSRVDKSENIGKYLKNNNKRIYLRVCLDDYRSDNCCNCEKCFRTIYGFISTGYDPSLVGFNIDNGIHKKIERAFKYRILLGHTRHWDKIKERISNDPVLSKKPELEWIKEYDFSKCNTHPIKYVVKVYYAIKDRTNRLIRWIKRG